MKSLHVCKIDSKKPGHLDWTVHGLGSGLNNGLDNSESKVICILINSKNMYGSTYHLYRSADFTIAKSIPMHCHYTNWNIFYLFICSVFSLLLSHSSTVYEKCGLGMETDELWFAFMARFRVTHLVMKKAKILPPKIL